MFSASSVDVENSNKYKLIDTKRYNINLFKVHFRVFDKMYSSDLFFNRIINEDKVNELCEVLKSEGNNTETPWTCHVVKDLSTGKKHIIDGQHRYEAIHKHISQDINMEIDDYVYIWEYTVENMEIESCRNYIIDLLKKLNNNIPFDPKDLPSTKIADLCSKLKYEKAFSDGIGYDDAAIRCNIPRIHIKSLFELFNKNVILLEPLTIVEIITNLKQINHNLFVISDKLYKNKTINANALKKAHKKVFYLGLKDSSYSCDYWIKFINNPARILE